MVLHLLGHKGWNVYNHANVERVRRDEADARAREEAREQRMQEEDAARRLAILRGEQPPPLPDVDRDPAPPSGQHAPAARDPAQPRKRRRRRGEDDTDADIRHAREDVEAGQRARTTLASARAQDHDAPLLDRDGHLQLIPAPDVKTTRNAEKNAEAEAEKAKKREREEDRSTMRFRNAAGFNSSAQQQPWYAAAAAHTHASGTVGQGEHAPVLAEAPGKDVWGNEDPLRKEREQRRVVQSDPFAAMQQAQRQLKQSVRDKEVWQREREREMEAVERRERHRKKRRRHHEDVDGLDGFALDEPERAERERHRGHRRRRRSRSREGMSGRLRTRS